MTVEQAEQLLIDSEQATLKGLDMSAPPRGGKAVTLVPLTRQVLSALTLTKMPTRHRTYTVQASWRWTGQFQLIDRTVIVKRRNYWIPVAKLSRSENDPWTLTTETQWPAP